MKTAQELLEEFEAELGWDVMTSYDLMLRYIERQGNNTAFQDFLSGVAVSERDQTEDTDED